MANLFQLLLAQIHPRQGRPAGEPERAEGYKTHPKRESNNKVRETRVLETGESTQERERIQTEVEKEDFLLSQIDEFREKAKQLQDLLAAKENKVQELQSIVNEREGKAEEWQHILVERQEEADKIVTEFTKKVDDLADRVTAKMTEIETSISGQVAEVKRASEEQLASNRKLNEDQIAANKKLSEEQLATNKQFLEEQAIANKKLSEDRSPRSRRCLRMRQHSWNPSRQISREGTFGEREVLPQHSGSVQRI